MGQLDHNAQGEVAMKRETRGTGSGTGKTNASRETAIQAPSAELSASAAWGAASPEKHPEQPAPPPTWTRYIDSRLKQFCVR